MKLYLWSWSQYALGDMLVKVAQRNPKVENYEGKLYAAQFHLTFSSLAVVMLDLLWPGIRPIFSP